MGRLLKMVSRWRKVLKAIEETKDVLEKANEVRDKYKDLPDDVQGVFKELSEARSAWVSLL